MARTAVAAEDPDEPEGPTSTPRPHLELVGEVPDDLQNYPSAEKVLTAADLEGFPASTRHRVAAFIHLQLAALEDLEDPVLPVLPPTDEL
ncbi:hypothetical protein [Nocardia huaxiensis]|uniref:Uncharacterized protein n=1 Tax=Nocardia huaxiensis TaxID=2755382 RepID=A0A7D6ZI62_9NOCA|nr:hypothetical protein [Nocardia huaxiensis]QLY30340.1 hypothetical protein H0264_35295 [Nocardia huaxiensis]UFS96024.1 hypothetical protein LPY97_36150 [Nocardia huaxiensis]